MGTRKTEVDSDTGYTVVFRSILLGHYGFVSEVSGFVSVLSPDGGGSPSGGSNQSTSVLPPSSSTTPPQCTHVPVHPSRGQTPAGVLFPRGRRRVGMTEDLVFALSGSSHSLATGPLCASSPS